MLDGSERPRQRNPAARSPGPPFIGVTRFRPAEVIRGADRALGGQRKGFPGGIGDEHGVSILAPAMSRTIQSRRRQFIPRRACCSPRNRPFSAEQAPKVPLSTDRRKSAMELPAPPSRRFLPSQKRPRQHLRAAGPPTQDRKSL